MSNAVLIVGAVAIVAILALAAMSLSRRRQQSGRLQQTGRLQAHFGSEYDRTVAEKGDVRSGESELMSRQVRVAKLHIRPLAADEGHGFNDEWRAVQMGFVDNPSVAVRDADALVGRVLDARGYPEGDFDQRFADVSVDHQKARGNYRVAHEITLRHAQGQANTEDLRQVILNDHLLFTDLIDEQPAADAEPITEAPTEAAVPVDTVPTDAVVPVDTAEPVAVG